MIKLLYLRPLHYVSSTQADYFKLSTPETISVCVGDFTEIMGNLGTEGESTGSDFIEELEVETSSEVN